MKVDLIRTCGGGDLSVVNAARVSFDKESDYDTGGALYEKDAKLIKYLAAHKHWSPFTHNFISLRVSAPIFVARQLSKHQVGLMWNEVSRRYVDAQPTMLEPIKWRSRADNVKQGSSDKEHRDNEHWQIVTQSMNWRTKMLYRHMIKEGVCPEQARMILPQSMYTEWIWSGNLYAFCNMIKLRTDPHTQLETKEIARMIASVIEPHFPISFKELVN